MAIHMIYDPHAEARKPFERSQLATSSESRLSKRALARTVSRPCDPRENQMYEPLD